MPDHPHLPDTPEAHRFYQSFPRAFRTAELGLMAVVLEVMPEVTAAQADRIVKDLMDPLSYHHADQLSTEPF